MYYILNPATRITWSLPNTLIIGAPPGAHCVIRDVPEALRGILARLVLPASKATLAELWMPLEAVSLDDILETLQWAGAVTVLAADSPSALAVQSTQRYGIIGLDAIGVLLAEQLASCEPRSFALSDTRHHGVHWPAIHGLREARTGTVRARDLAARLRSYGIPAKVYTGVPPAADVYAICGDNLVDPAQALPLHHLGQPYLNVRYGGSYSLVGPMTNPLDPDSPCATCDVLWRSAIATDDWISGETYSLISLRGGKRASATSYHAFSRMTDYYSHRREAVALRHSPDKVLVLDNDGLIVRQYRVLSHPECWCATSAGVSTPVCTVATYGG